MQFLHFHTIPSILKLKEEITDDINIRNFHTIPSILKPSHEGLFKAAKQIAFPYDSVYFKALSNLCALYNVSCNFHTIPSILKRYLAGAGWSPDDNFHTIPSILKPKDQISIALNSINFHTIPSILKLSSTVERASPSALFPYDSVYFKADRVKAYEMITRALFPYDSVYFKAP